MNSMTKIFVTRVKRLEPATYCVGNQDVIRVPAIHMWETGSLNRAEFMIYIMKSGKMKHEMTLFLTMGPNTNVLFQGCARFGEF